MLSPLLQITSMIPPYMVIQSSFGGNCQALLESWFNSANLILGIQRKMFPSQVGKNTDYNSSVVWKNLFTIFVGEQPFILTPQKDPPKKILDSSHQKMLHKSKN